LLALRQVLDRLGVGAPHVIFGHTHRAGPLPGDDPAEWAGLLNTGCWTYGLDFLRDSASGNPYRPGFCAILDDAGAPQLVNLLDGRVELSRA
jgi:hypothetical protein